jgi:DNA gyrase subunit B
MICEVVHNAVNGALSGQVTRIDVVLNADGSATVRDDGRGAPVDTDERTGRFVTEMILTELHAVGGRYDMHTPRVPDILVGVGLCVVNALSDRLELRIRREGKKHLVRCRRGIPEAPLEVIGTAPGEHGTEVTFLPDSRIFATIEFDGQRLESRLGELRRLTSNAEIVFTDLRTGRTT